MIFDRIEFADRYLGLAPRLAAALEFLRRPDLFKFPDGRHELDADRLFALVQSYRTKHYDECRWEAHRRYVDAKQTHTPRMREILAALAEVCEHTARPDEAQRWRNELESLAPSSSQAATSRPVPATLPATQRVPQPRN